MVEETYGMEEAFFEQHFDCGDDADTYLDNFHEACVCLKDSYKECEKYAEMIENGEIIDECEVVFQLQVMALAYQYGKQFSSWLSSHEPTLIPKECF